MKTYGSAVEGFGVLNVNVFDTFGGSFTDWFDVSGVFPLNMTIGCVATYSDPLGYFTMFVRFVEDGEEIEHPYIVNIQDDGSGSNQIVSNIAYPVQAIRFDYAFCTLTIEALIPGFEPFTYDEPLDEHFADVASLLHFDESNASVVFTDVTGKVWTPVGNAQISTAESKWGGSSSVFDGVGDYATTPAAAWEFGVADFTVEFWYNPLVLPVAAGALQTPVSVWDATGGNRSWRIHLRQTAGNVHQVSWVQSSNGVAAVGISGTWTPVVGDWYHIAVSRNDGVLRIFVDGVMIAETLTMAGAQNVSGRRLMLGALDDSFAVAEFTHGYVDDFRITKVVGRYTKNFVPPNRPFPNTA